MANGTLVGNQVGNYVLRDLLGEGGMGAVYLAEHPRIGLKVAVKILRTHIPQADAAARFEAEAKVLSQLEHENIVKIYDFGSLPDGSLYYVMEVLKGRVLLKTMKETRRMSALKVLPYLEQICAGLQVAHDHGVIHRDLKPENIFVLDKEPLALKILDFGIAKLLEGDVARRMTAPGLVMGTPLYIAPEQALGKAALLGPAMDIYSLGVILYFMLCGSPPFWHKDSMALLKMHIKEAPPPLAEQDPSIPPGVVELVHRCLEKNPAARPASALQVLADYQAGLKQRQAEQQAPAGVEPGDRPAGQAAGSPRTRDRAQDNLSTVLMTGKEQGAPRGPVGEPAATDAGVTVAPSKGMEVPVTRLGRGARVAAALSAVVLAAAGLGLILWAQREKQPRTDPGRGTGAVLRGRTTGADGPRRQGRGKAAATGAGSHLEGKVGAAGAAPDGAMEGGQMKGSTAGLDRPLPARAPSGPAGRSRSKRGSGPARPAARVTRPGSRGKKAPVRRTDGKTAPGHGPPGKEGAQPSEIGEGTMPVDL